MTRRAAGILIVCLFAPGILAAAAHAAADAAAETRRLARAATVVTELRTLPESTLPDRLFEDCTCIAVFPGVIKGAFGWGARLGRGVVSCRDSSDRWSPPSFLTLTGGSFGLQFGLQSVDLVLFVMTPHGARSLIRSGFTLGGTGSVAAGPVGRSAEGSTDIRLAAEIYSYARAKGLFAGISLEGARLNTDGRAVERFYGMSYTPETILFDQAVSRPAAADTFLRALPAGPTAGGPAVPAVGPAGEPDIKR